MSEIENGSCVTRGFGQPETPPPPPAMVARLLDNALICICRGVTKGVIQSAICGGHRTVDGIGQATTAGQGCGTCQAALGELLTIADKAPQKTNKIEEMKLEKDGLDCLPDIERFMASGNWQEMTEDDKHRFKWHGLFFRKQTPGNFMLRLRMTGGFTSAEQFRVIADLSDQYGKGFCDLTTRQQMQMRWFTIADVPDIWRRLDEVGLHSKQTGMDNIRGVCGCPVAGLTPHEMFDASAVCPGIHPDCSSTTRSSPTCRASSTSRSPAAWRTAATPRRRTSAWCRRSASWKGKQVNGFNVSSAASKARAGYTPARASTCSSDPKMPPACAARSC